MPDIESSAIRHIEHDPGRSILLVTFVTGLTYRYDGVPGNVYQALLASDSKGASFNRAVRDRYTTTLLGSDQASPNRSATSASRPGGSSRSTPSERMRVSMRPSAPRR